MPRLIEFHDTYRNVRDKFAILAFHDESAASFEVLDRELRSVEQLYWHGASLPFPILLDSTGETIANYGVNSFPTAVLIDPDGKLVGEVGIEALASRLPPGVPRTLAERIVRGLDQQVAGEFADRSLTEAITMLAQASGLPIEFDSDAVAARRVALSTVVPLKLRGQLSLRSWLDLVLEAHSLEFETTPDAIVVTAHGPAGGKKAQESPPQRYCRERIEARLAENVSFNFEQQTLASIAAHFESETRENFILDPTARQAGRLDPDTKVTGAAKSEPLASALARLLAPVEMTFEIRNELVVLTPVGATDPDD